MGIIQENRYGIAGPEKVTTDYGVENVNVTSKGVGGKNSAEPTEAEKKARLFSDLMTIILVKNKFKPGDERIEEFGHRMDIIVKEDSIEIPKPDDIVKVLKEVGLTDIADAYEKVLAGADIEAVVEDMPDVVEDASEEETDDTQEPESEETTDKVADACVAEETTEETETPEADADAEEETEVADAAPAEENVAASPEAESPADTAEAPGRRRPGRPSSKK